MNNHLEALQPVSVFFPDLAPLIQSVLDHLGGVPTTRPAEGLFHSLIRQHSDALAAIGVRSAAFTEAGSAAWRKLDGLVDGKISFKQHPLQVKLNPLPQTLRNLMNEARRLLDLLAVAPATALEVPKMDTSKPARKPRLSVDHAAFRIVLDGVSYEATPAQVAIIAALLAAGGDWVSAPEMKATSVELEGVRCGSCPAPAGDDLRREASPCTETRR
jgi:hypothetical protein